MQRKPLIIDTDIGGDVDDTWTLGMLFRSDAVELKGITTETGDPLYRAALCAKLLETAGLAPVPIGLGKPGIKKRCCQGEWLGDYRIPAAFDLSRSPVSVIAETVRKSEVPVTLLAIGPLSNPADLVREAPDVIGKIDLVAMGGSVFRGYFGRETPSLEYNIMADAESAKTVFRAPWHSALLVPLDICGNVLLRGEKFQTLKRSDAVMAKAVMANHEIWCKWKLAAKEECPYKYEVESTLLADPAAAALIVKPELAKIEELPLSVTDEGMTVVDRGNGTPMQVALDWHDVEEFYDLVLELLMKF